MRHRGEFVTAVIPGDYGKPRPVLVVQAERYAGLPSIVVCPLTTHLVPDAEEFRPTINPNVENGLRHPSQVMVDKVSVVPLMRIGEFIGIADTATMQRVSSALAGFLGIV